MECTSVVLKAFINEGLPGPEHFDMQKSAVPAKLEKAGSIMVQALAMSADPYLRMRFKSEGNNGFPQAVLGKPVDCFVCAQVIESKHEDWKVGELLCGNLPLSTLQVLDLSKPGHFIWKLPSLKPSNISLGLGVLGMPGGEKYYAITQS
jgi:NADPH-dependent curcumin reductase CurA